MVPVINFEKRRSACSAAVMTMCVERNMQLCTVLIKIVAIYSELELLHYIVESLLKASATGSTRLGMNLSCLQFQLAIVSLFAESCNKGDKQLT
jgi:hypothetical protein